MSPLLAINAKDGSQCNHGRLSEEGGGWAINHSFPFTALGRNSIPSSAMNSRNAAFVPFSLDALAKARSVSTIVVIGDDLPGVWAMRRDPSINNKIKVQRRFITIVLKRSTIPH